MKFATMFVFAAVMMFAATITAYADYNGYAGYSYDYETEEPETDTGDEYETEAPDTDIDYDYEAENPETDYEPQNGNDYPDYENELPYEPPTQEPPVQEPPTYDPPIQEPPIQNPPAQDPEPTPPPIETGRLLITLRAQGTNALLGGGIFEIRRAMDNELIATIMTDYFGEAAIDLPIGDYFVREIEPSSNFIPNPNRINVRIAANRISEVNVTSRPILEQTPPTVETGRLLVTLRAHGTNALLSGAVFEVRSVIDNEVVATLITDGFGEATATLPIGDFFLRELQPPRGFIPNPDRINVRIAANRLNEVNITNRPIPEPTTTPTPTPPTQAEAPPEPGRLIITVRADGTNEFLHGARFEVRRAMDNRLMAELITDRFGEAAVTLPVGDYHVRQISSIAGFDFNPDRINVRIAASAINDITITNQAHAIIPPEPPATVPQPGRLLLTVTSEETAERLEGATFTVHHVMTDEIISIISTNRFGEASVFLPQGDYFMRHAAVPEGFVMSMDRINFTIRDSEITDMLIPLAPITPPTPEPTPQPTPTAPRPAVPVTPPSTAQPRQGRIEIITRAEQSGNPIVGVVFGVYRTSDNVRVTEITTDFNGFAYLSLPQGDYFLRNYAVPFGFLHERARIFFTVSGTGTVRIDVTAQRDSNIPYADYGFITLPQTGELLPVRDYVLGGVFIFVGVLLIVMLWMHGRHNEPNETKNKRKGAKAYA